MISNDHYQHSRIDKGIIMTDLKDVAGIIRNYKESNIISSVVADRNAGS